MLPKIEYPLYEIYLHSLGRKVKARPFTVKEEKILLIAKESKDPEAAKLSIKQIIQNCCQEDIDIDKLPLFDIEMFFVKLRAKSVGETVKLSFNCQNMVINDAVPLGPSIPCNADTDYVLDLDKVQYVIPEGHNSTVMVTDKIGIVLKYPTLENTVGDIEDNYDSLLSLLLESVESIFDENSVTLPENVTNAELTKFIEGITSDVFEKIKIFFQTSPKVVLRDMVKCSKCNYEHTLHTEGLLDFFV